MLTPAQFKERWQDRETDRLVPFPASSLEEVRIPEDVKAFLLQAGLPEDAAPFLSFGPPKKGPLPRASETLWHLTPDFACYRVIGSNGAGDPVCIQEASGQIVYLNHDNYFEPILMASSVFTLAECLLAFRNGVAEAGASISAAHIQQLAAQLDGIDPAACEENGFWPAACRSLAQ